MSLVSIVIPAYNCAGTIERTVLSILNDSHNNVEILVINDGSTDGTERILNNLAANPALKLSVIHQPNLGANTARNVGMEAAKGKYIQFFDADDLMLNNKLERSVRVFSSDKNLVCVYCDGCFDNDASKNFEASHTNILAILAKEFTEFTFGLNTNMPLFKTNFLRKTKEFWDISLSCWQEAEFYFRVLLQSSNENQRFHHLPVVGFSRTLNSSGISSNRHSFTYTLDKLTAIKNIYLICFQRGLVNPQLSDQVDRFMWLIYKDAVINSHDSLIPQIIDTQNSQQWLRRVTQGVPPSILRRAVTIKTFLKQR